MIYGRTKKELQNKLPKNFDRLAMNEFKKIDINSNGHIKGDQIILLLKIMG